MVRDTAIVAIEVE